MIREEIKNLVEKAIKELYGQEANVRIDQPENGEFGDYSTNAAMLLKKNPQEIVNVIKSDFLEKIEIKDGFINFFVSKEYLQKQVGEILKQKPASRQAGNKFGSLKIGANQKINVEFISANPTGPLTLGNGRGGFCGDVLANVLEKAGYKVTREYYLNDRGEQIIKLGHSVLGDESAVYKGKYIEELNKEVKEKNPEKAGSQAAKIIFEKMIKPAIKKMAIKFDVWFSEKSLYQKGEVKKTSDLLKRKNLVYENEGALWFKSTQFGDDKDRVLIKENKEETYFLSDIAYLKNKFDRGFKKLIFFWGADHYGYVARLKAAAEALGYRKDQIDIIIMQLVRLMQGGQEVRMAKRTGIYVTIDELIDEIGLDVARFFFLTRSPNTHLNFDLDLAKEQSEKNPVFYIQYAYARISSIIKKAGLIEVKPQPSLLNHSSELNLVKQLIKLPEVVEDITKDYQVQRLPQYATDLATAFHQFYRDCKILSEAEGLQKARLGLVLATKIILKNTLDLMGISAPEKM
ncbi:MAG: arginine--tRNA ligase [Patescibacteria group bacterium]